MTLFDNQQSVSLKVLSNPAICNCRESSILILMIMLQTIQCLFILFLAASVLQIRVAIGALLTCRWNNNNFGSLLVTRVRYTGVEWSGVSQ